MYDTVSNFLINFGMKDKACGFDYVLNAIILYIDSNFNPLFLGKEMYLHLENKYAKSYKTIEKNITSIIERAYLKGDLEFIIKHNMVSQNPLGRPSNKEFIALAAENIYFNS